MKPGERAWRMPRVCWPWTTRRSDWRDFWNNMANRQQLIDFLGGKPRRVHFVGIGGCGMSGLARLLLQQGHLVSGSDLSPNGGTKDLQKLGARIYTGHAAKNVGEDTELVVYTSAVNGENVELQAADERKIPRVRRGLLLSALMNHSNNIAVAGTHGKTTTTAMIAYVLTRSDSAPSYCVGAHIPVLGTNAQIQPGVCRVPEHRARASRSLRFDGQAARNL